MSVEDYSWFRGKVNHKLLKELSELEQIIFGYEECGCGARKKHISPLTWECNSGRKKEMGKYCVIRPDSQSGHSPSHRYNTEKEAIAAAKSLAQERAPATFEVVRVLKRVSTVPSVKVTVVG